MSELLAAMVGEKTDPEEKITKARLRERPSADLAYTALACASPPGRAALQCIHGPPSAAKCLLQFRASLCTKAPVH